MEHVADPNAPITCTLPPAAASSRLGEWERLVALATTCQPVPAGWSLAFPAAVAPVVEDLAAREAACCSFLTLTTNLGEEVVRLDITAEAVDARQVIGMLLGAEASRRCGRSSLPTENGLRPQRRQGLRRPPGLGWRSADGAVPAKYEL